MTLNATGSTISLPTTSVKDLEVVSIETREDRSNYAVILTWTRPIGWPVVTRYYASYTELLTPSYNMSGAVWKAAAGTAYLGRKVLDSTLSPLTYMVEKLSKGSRYALRVHVGNNDGIDGFYPDMQNDPYASNVVTVWMEDRPLRPRIGVVSPSLPDRNSMLSLTFEPPDVGGIATSYYAESQDCGSGPVPMCSTIELAIDDPSRQLVRETDTDGQQVLKRYLRYGRPLAPLNASLHPLHTHFRTPPDVATVSDVGGGQLAADCDRSQEQHMVPTSCWSRKLGWRWASLAALRPRQNPCAPRAGHQPAHH